MMTSQQMRAARALLRQSQKELAEASGVSVPTVQRMENRAGLVSGNMDTLLKVIAVFESGGVQLINENEASLAGGRGVRFKSAD